MQPATHETAQDTTDPPIEDPPTEASPVEARQHQRQVAKLDVELNFAGDDNFYNGFSEDISEGGLFVATYMPLEIGKELLLRFNLPNDHDVEVMGVVRWRRETFDGGSAPGMGIQFTNLSEEDAEHVRAFVAQREPIFYCS